MRRYSLLFLLLLLSTTSLFAQDWRRARRTPYEDRFELTPFIGYRWGGTIFADQTFILTQDVDVQSSAALGVNLGIPLGESGMKLELMANRQSSELEIDDGLFDPRTPTGEIDITYLHAGLQIPFARSRNLTPYVIASAGIANLDPQLSVRVSDETRFSASAGIGIKAPISNNLSFRFEGRGYYTALEDESDCRICDYYYNRDFYQGEVNLGLVFSF